MMPTELNIDLLQMIGIWIVMYLRTKSGAYMVLMVHYACVQSNVS